MKRLKDWYNNHYGYIMNVLENIIRWTVTILGICYIIVCIIILVRLFGELKW